MGRCQLAETDPRLLRYKRMLMRRHEARPPQLLIFVLCRATPLPPARPLKYGHLQKESDALVPQLCILVSFASSGTFLSELQRLRRFGLDPSSGARGNPLGTRIRTTSWTQNFWREPAGNPHEDNVMNPKFLKGTGWEPAYGQRHEPKISGGNRLGIRIRTPA